MENKMGEMLKFVREIAKFFLQYVNNYIPKNMCFLIYNVSVQEQPQNKIYT